MSVWVTDIGSEPICWAYGAFSVSWYPRSVDLHLPPHPLRAMFSGISLIHYPLRNILLLFVGLAANLTVLNEHVSWMYEIWNLKMSTNLQTPLRVEKNISPEGRQFKWIILKQTLHETQFNDFLCIVWEHYHQTTKQRYLPHDFRSNRPRKQRNLCIFVLAVLSCSYYKKSVWVVTWSRNLIWLSSKQSSDTLFSKSWRKNALSNPFQQEGISEKYLRAEKYLP